jgi:hypothetical protein
MTCCISAEGMFFRVASAWVWEAISLDFAGAEVFFLAGMVGKRLDIGNWILGIFNREWTRMGANEEGDVERD